MNDSTKIDEAAIAETDPRIAGAMQPCSDRTSMVLWAIGAGLAIGLIVRALRPQPTRTERVSQLLADLEDRLRDATRPTLRRASAYASDGAEVLRDRLHTGEARIGRIFHDATRGVRKLFS